MKNAEYYTFDNFLVGTCNRFAYTAAVTVSESPLGNAYNPLIFNGETGTGKTHLLLAIGNRIKQQGYQVLYMTTEELTERMIQAINNDTFEEYRASLRAVDCLLLDNLQDANHKESTMKELRLLAEDLVADGKLLVCACGVPLDEMELPAELLSRLHYGLLAEVQPFDHDTARAFLLAQAKNAGIQLIEGEMEQILSGSRDARTLIGEIHACRLYRQISGQLSIADVTN